MWGWHVGQGTTGTHGPDEPDDPDDGWLADGSVGGEVHPLEALEQGRVDPRLLRPDPGESRQQFEARLLATVLGLDPGPESPPRACDAAEAAEDGPDADGSGGASGQS